MAEHIGKRIKKVFDAQVPKVPVTAFADAIGRSRKNVYDIFKQPSVDTRLLKKISEVLKHDFFQYLGHQDKAGTVAEPQERYGAKRTSLQTPMHQLQVTVILDAADPDAKRKLDEIYRILNS
ncbi:MAG: hypothetical protein JNL05_13080 [Flavobacteriales bacterium]|nr:hypothetical protein [Flavobacteriales bacterium]